jgi:hypothetical protein
LSRTCRINHPPGRQHLAQRERLGQDTTGGEAFFAGEAGGIGGDHAGHGGEVDQGREDEHRTQQ